MIEAVGPAAALRMPAEARVVNLGGRTIMPGLIDAHTHLTYHAGEYALILGQGFGMGGSRAGPCTENPLRWPPRKSA